MSVPDIRGTLCRSLPPRRRPSLHPSPSKRAAPRSFSGASRCQPPLDPFPARLVASLHTPEVPNPHPQWVGPQRAHPPSSRQRLWRGVPSPRPRSRRGVAFHGRSRSSAPACPSPRKLNALVTVHTETNTLGWADTRSHGSIRKEERGDGRGKRRAWEQGKRKEGTTARNGNGGDGSERGNAGQSRCKGHMSRERTLGKRPCVENATCSCTLPRNDEARRWKHHSTTTRGKGGL